MSNPVGYSIRTAPPQGLALCGTTVGFVTDWVGGGAEPTVHEPPTEFFYAAPIGGPWSTPPYSDSPIDAVLIGGLPGPPYNPVDMNNSKTTTGTSTIAAEACAATSCTYVEIELGIAVTGGPGFVHFSDTVDPSGLNSFGLSMTGFGALSYQGDTYDATDNADLAVANAAIVAPDPDFAGTTEYDVSSRLLRPTALTWAGQDPDNLANRNVWLASEVDAITWEANVYSSTIDVNFNVTVHGRVLSTDYPAPCPFVELIGTVINGPYVSGERQMQHRVVGGFQNP